MLTEKQIETVVRAIARALKEAGLTSDRCCAPSEPRREPVKACTPAVVVCLCGGETRGYGT